jgi:hypothetical protein
MIETYSFSDALTHMQNGGCVSRLQWGEEKTLSIAFSPHARGNITVPYIQITFGEWDTAPWTASHADMLTDDWILHGE